MTLTKRLILTALVAVIWGFMIAGGVLARRRTIESLQSQEGLSLADARRRVTVVGYLVALIESAAAVVALLLIW